jgi:hypothetical protein
MAWIIYVEPIRVLDGKLAESICGYCGKPLDIRKPPFASFAMDALMQWYHLECAEAMSKMLLEDAKKAREGAK